MEERSREDKDRDMKILKLLYWLVGSPAIQTNCTLLYGGFPLLPKRLTLKSNPPVYRWLVINFGWIPK